MVAQFYPLMFLSSPAILFTPETVGKLVLLSIGSTTKGKPTTF
uniref:Uncharacterized protein n=1 Tax=Anguilla anguilla TaxID=7936 RepID=A0A0E9UUN3_ANGAN